MKAIIIEKNAAGLKRPAFIDPETAKKRVADGSAILAKQKQGHLAIYLSRELAPKNAALPEDLDSVVDEAEDSVVEAAPLPKPEPQTYETRDMVATPRRRGRPRKTAP